MFKRIEVLVEHGPALMCCSAPELAIHEGDLCIVKAGSVLEFGRVSHLEEIDGVIPQAERPPLVLRRATLQDQSKATENALLSKMAQDACVKKMSELKLEMHLINVRYSFDRTVLTIAFMAEWAVDFRELVRSLQSELKAQIEMRQIGVRDTAKMVGGFGACGQYLCCARWLKAFDTVSIKMAKTQRLSLSPNTISGMCGRLKCCLRYEHECYKECAQQLPRDGAVVQCPGGTGQVLDKDILAQRVKVRLEDDRVMEYEAGEVTPVK